MEVEEVLQASSSANFVQFAWLCAWLRLKDDTSGMAADCRASCSALVRWGRGLAEEGAISVAIKVDETAPSTKETRTDPSSKG